MSQVRLTWLADVLRAEGLRVKTYDGWRTRSRPTGDFKPFGVLWHHTGTPTSMERPAPTVGLCIRGRSDLPGPLCQVVIGFDGLCHVIAAGRANHAGTNDGVGTGPIPAGDGNAQMVGFEFDYSGSQDMGPLQMAAGIKASAAVLRKLGRDHRFARGHKETSTSGKWDPGRKGSSSPEYVMGGIRERIRAAMAPPPDRWTYQMTNAEGVNIGTASAPFVAGPDEIERLKVFFAARAHLAVKGARADGDIAIKRRKV